MGMTLHALHRSQLEKFVNKRQQMQESQTSYIEVSFIRIAFQIKINTVSWRVLHKKIKSLTSFSSISRFDDEEGGILTGTISGDLKRRAVSCIRFLSASGVERASKFDEF